MADIPADRSDVSDPVDIAPLHPSARSAAMADLIVLLQDAVDGGASVGFLGPLAAVSAERYWHERLDEAAAGTRVILAARSQGRIVGSVQLAFASQENGRHRAELQRLIVLRAAQRRGIGRALVRRAETAARELGRTLLLLNTRAGDPPEALYRRLGYTVVGTVPAFARNPDGSMNTTTIMYRHLDGDRAPATPTGGPR